MPAASDPTAWLLAGIRQATDAVAAGLDPEATEDPEEVLAAVQANAGNVALETLAAPENRDALAAWLVDAGILAPLTGAPAFKLHQSLGTPMYRLMDDRPTVEVHGRG